MKTKLLTISGICIGMITLHAQNQDTSTSADDNEITSSPLMMFFKSLLPEKTQGFKNSSFSTSPVTDQNRRNEFLPNDDDRHDSSTASNASEISPVLSEEAITKMTPPIEKPGDAIVATILSRQYLNLDPKEFEVIAGPSRTWQMSQQRNQLVDELREYQSLKTAPEKTKKLLTLESLAKTYLEVKERSFQIESQKELFSLKEVEQARRRIDACKLLLRGIHQERRMMSVEPKSETSSPLVYRSQFALGALIMDSEESVDHVAHDGKNSELSSQANNQHEKQQLGDSLYSVALTTLDESRLSRIDDSLRSEAPEGHHSFFSDTFNAVRRLGILILNTGQESFLGLSGLLEKRPSPVQRLLVKSNLAYIDASLETYLRNLLLKTAQQKTSSSVSLNELPALWSKVIDRLVKEKRSWESAIISYEEERDAERKHFLRSPREASFQQAKNQKKIAADHLLWARMHEAESIRGIMPQYACQADGKQNTVLSKENQQLAKFRQAWSLILSRVSMISDSSLPQEWSPYFEIKKDDPFYDKFLETCSREYASKYALQHRLFQDAYDHVAAIEKNWNDLIQGHDSFEDVTSELYREAEYQKKNAMMSHCWISVREQKDAIDLLKFRINAITNCPHTLGQDKEVSELLQLWTELKDRNQSLQANCDACVEVAEQLRSLDPGRFNESIYKDRDIQHAYFRFKMKQAKDFSECAINAFKQSLPNAKEQLLQAQLTWNEIINFYQSYRPLEDWKPSFYFEAGQKSYNRELDTLELTIDVKDDLRSAMKLYSPDGDTYKALEEITGDSCPAFEQWTLELTEAIQEKIKIDNVIKDLS